MLDRRTFMKTCSGMGLAGSLFPGVLWAQAQAQGGTKITKEMIDNAAAIADVAIADEYKAMLLEDLSDRAKGYEEVYQLKIPNSADPALTFDPVLPGMKFETERRAMRMSMPPSVAPGAPNIEDLAFASVRELAELARTKKVSSVALTEMYLGRLKRFDPNLKFVVTLTEERARAKAKKADAEMAAGKYRGPLHGLPWGAKDLLATKGYRTTWGAGGFENQMIDEDATVVKRLDEAGAVLVAKIDAGCAGAGGCLVRRSDAESLEHKSGIERLVGRPGFGYGGRLRGVQHRLGKRWARFRRPPPDADALDCGRRSDWCREPARWRFPGAWISCGRSAGR